MNLRVPVIAALALLLSAGDLRAQGLPPPPPPSLRSMLSDPAPPRGRRFALIVTGLPGDEEHAAAFQRNAQAWRKFLTTHGGVASDRLVALFGKPAFGSTTGTDNSSDAAPAATRENITLAITDLTSQLTPDDALWVFLQGHGSHDDRHAWLHLPGSDLTAAEWADLFARVPAREQVFWITQSASGGFLRPFSQRGRIVITATAPTGEVNETIFPEVLAEHLNLPTRLSDANHDGRVSILELFQAVSSQVAAQYEEQSLAATEHPLLDDNGDGDGTESADLEPDAPADTNLDGPLAARTFLHSH